MSEAQQTDTTGDAGGDASAAAADRREDRRRLLRQGAWHLVAAFLAIGIWAALDSWRELTGLPVATGLSVLAAVLAGIGLSHLFHEWGHFAGARLSGARSPVKPEPAFLMFDFDYQGNSGGQFLCSGIAGSAGNLLLVLLVALSIPLDAPGRSMLLATALGMMAYVALLEWPALLHMFRNRDPIAAMTHGFGRPGVFTRATWGGVATALLVWILLLL